jgi:adenosylhomocysteinase
VKKEDLPCKDITLAPQGKKKIEWVQRHMPVLEYIKKQFKRKNPFEG